jgi:heme exporter protein C
VKGDWLTTLAAILLVANVPLTLLVAPQAIDASGQPDLGGALTQRIFYWHVPAAWVAYLAFAVTAAASGVDLWRGKARWDALAAASAEVGLLFALLALVTGLLWSGRTFGGGYSPLTDAKVITLLVVVLSYGAYFALRASIDDRDKRARLAAVYGVLSFLAVPLSYLASRVSVHPDFARADETLDPALGWFLLLSLVALTILYAALVQVRLRLARAEEAMLP